MSLADESSLLFIPTGYKESKIYSVFPTTGVGDFTFNRNSSATRIAKNGLITSVATDIPRLEYPMIDGVVSGCPSLLLEPQRTNLLTYSEDFSNAYWSPNSNALISLSSNLSPDGTANAYRVEAVTGTQVGYVGTTTIGTTVTHSIWVRRISGSTTFNMTDVNNINTSVNITSDWQRFSITSTATSTNLRSYFKTTALGDVVEIYGAQLEEGSYPTSYIPTNGTTVTRLADTANGAGDATTFNDSEGVLMAEISALTDDSRLREIALSDGSLSNRLELRYGAASNRIQFVARSGGVVQASISNEGNNIILNNKIVIKYKLNDFALWVNGFELGIDNSGSIPIGLSELALDDGSGINNFYGKTKQIQYFQTALTDSELEQLTSWVSFTDMANGQLYKIE